MCVSEGVYECCSYSRKERGEGGFTPHAGNIYIYIYMHITHIYNIDWDPKTGCVLEQNGYGRRS